MGAPESGHEPLRKAKIKSVIDRSVGHNRPTAETAPSVHLVETSSRCAIGRITRARKPRCDSVRSGP